MKILLTIATSALVTFLSAVGIYNGVPLSYLEWEQPDERLGATVTTINATDLISTSRTTINDNFTNLNRDKMEVSTTSVASITTLANLVTAGTLTTGTWNADTLTVAYGGTGSTTLSSNQVLLGNGTGNIGIVSGYGTTGQFLTSNGSGSAPTWQTSAVDTAIDYTWTGAHTFASTTDFTYQATFATTTMATTTVTSLTTTNVPYIASTTIFTTSGTWVKPASVTQVEVTVVGAGGGGGGVDSTSGTGCTGGGGAGGYAEATVDVSGNVTVTVGAAGAGGVGVGSNTGTAGGNSSFAGDVTVTANGGSGGQGNGGDSQSASGGGGGGTTNADLGITGGTGQSCLANSAFFELANGGSNPLGQGGARVNGDSGGLAGSGYGGGGGGALDTNVTARNGGAGTGGLVKVRFLIPVE